ncbi:MAG TPA: 30S ribosomal protein S21 [Bacteroidia bacterium]|jgi:small subunit ribosomal protein S21|nr:30S ribosomal protein S21 [Bacteroidia bacterium]
MLIVQVKEGDTIEKALKKFKKKFEKTGVVKQLRARQKFTKPSVRRREEIIKAVYKQKLQTGEIVREKR